MVNGSITTGITQPPPPRGGYAHVHCDPILCHIGNRDMIRGRWTVGGGLVPSPNTAPHIFYKRWVGHEEGIDYHTCLCRFLLSIYVQEDPDLTAQVSDSCPILCQGPAEGNPEVHGSPHLRCDPWRSPSLHHPGFWYCASQVRKN